MSNITVNGLVATTPRHLITQDGLPITSFRLASAGDNDNTNWFTITAFSALAVNSSVSLSKGDRVVVSGSLRIRDWDNGERAGTSVEVDASSIGHDLSFGTSTFTRTVHKSNDGSTTVELPVAETTTEDANNHSCSCSHCGN